MGGGGSLRLCAVGGTVDPTAQLDGEAGRERPVPGRRRVSFPSLAPGASWSQHSPKRSLSCSSTPAAGRVAGARVKIAFLSFGYQSARALNQGDSNARRGGKRQNPLGVEYTHLTTHWKAGLELGAHTPRPGQRWCHWRTGKPGKTVVLTVEGWSLGMWHMKQGRIM